MMDGLTYLALRSARNRLRQFVIQLRKPGYLVAVVVGIGYLVMLLRQPRSHTVGFGPEATELVGALGILVLAASAWVFGSGKSLLAFTGAERTLLLPAPLPASRILNFQLLGLQTRVWRNVLLWTLLSGAGLSTVMLGQRAVALWTLLTTLQWHRLVSGRIQDPVGQTSSRGRAIRIIGVLLVACVPFLMSGVIGEGVPGLKVILEGLTASPFLRILLWPFAVPLRPFIASSTTSFGRALVPAILMLGAHYLWLRHLGIDTESSPGEQPASARGVPLWRLSPSGAVASAFLWKNFTALLRRPSTITVTGAALVLVLLPAILRSAGREPAAAFIGWMTLVWSAILLVVGPQFVRNDLRRDQRQLELLRSLPVRGYSVLLGSAGAAAVVLLLGVSALLTTGVLGTRGSPDIPVPETLLPQALAGAIMILGPLCFAGILIQDGALLLFPGWSKLTGRRGSPTALGANIANSVATLLLLGVLLALPLGAGLLASGNSIDAPWALVRLGFATAALLAAECWLILLWLGSRFDGLQPVRTAG